MGRHNNEVGVDTGAFELADHTVQYVRQVADDLWTVAGFCAGDPLASAAMESVVSYLRDLVVDDSDSDPEITAFGITEFLHEVKSVEDAVSDHPTATTKSDPEVGSPG